MIDASCLLPLLSIRALAFISVFFLSQSKNVDGFGRVETGTANTMSFLCTTDHPAIKSCQIRQHPITVVKASAGL
ncbi:hypothetical protein EV424DRAFT_1098457 [Suillus variegatus]|nr:hypothetical protein EV424DRAFT_1098457 [Suillus variegatus]